MAHLTPKGCWRAQIRHYGRVVASKTFPRGASKDEAGKVFNVSESGYHAWRRRPPSQRTSQNARIMAHLKASFKNSRGT